MLLTKARDESLTDTTDLYLQCTHVDPYIMVKSGHFVVKVSLVPGVYSRHQTDEN